MILHIFKFCEKCFEKSHNNLFNCAKKNHQFVVQIK